MVEAARRVKNQNFVFLLTLEAVKEEAKKKEEEKCSHRIKNLG